MTKHFVQNPGNIKVDREERPDIDYLYMTSVHAMGLCGGWPLSVFLTSDRKPFYGGTYFPPVDRPGMPGFITILNVIAKAWKSGRLKLVQHADAVIRSISPPGTANQDLHAETFLRKAAAQFADIYEPEFGGFSISPKFPMGHALSFLLRCWYRFRDNSALDMVTHTLDQMAAGGIYDHLAGGFHRYSTDTTWLVPHFEKMLYDQALLAKAYAEAFLITGNDTYGRIVRETLFYVTGYMRHPDGPFFSAEDADSENEEGKFYLWSRDEILTALGECDGDLFCRYYGVRGEGNFEGKAILTARLRMDEFAADNGMKPGDATARLERCRDTLRAIRDRRTRPFRDEKILTDWNGLMISAFAYASGVMREPGYATVACAAARFVLSNLRRNDGRLLKCWRDREAAGLALRDDYAFLCNGLIDLYAATFEPEWLVKAKSLCMDMLKLFNDEFGGGFFLAPNDGEALVVNPKHAQDGALPSGNSAALMALVRLAHYSGDTGLQEQIETSFRAFSSDIDTMPSGFPSLLTALDYHCGPQREIVIAPGENEFEAKALVEEVRGTFSPWTVVLLHKPDASCRALETIAPFVKNLIARDNRTTLYACKNHTCALPVTNMDEARNVLKGE